MAEMTFADILKASDKQLADEQVEFTLLEDGDYECVVEDAEAGVSQAGNPKITLTMKVVDTNRKLWFYLNFSDNEKSRGITLRTLKSLGLDPGELLELKVSPRVVFQDMRLIAKVETDEWEGKKRNKVRWINPVAGVNYERDLKATVEAAEKPAAPANPFG